jgi:hypothetical protein
MEMNSASVIVDAPRIGIAKVNHHLSSDTSENEN